MNTGLALAHNNSIPGYVPQRNSYIHASRKIYKFVPRSSASIVKTKEKALKYPSAREWISKLRYSYTVSYYIKEKMNE